MSGAWTERVLMSSRASVSGSTLSCAPLNRIAPLQNRQATAGLQAQRQVPTSGLQDKRQGSICRATEEYPAYPDIDYSPLTNEEYWELRPVKVMNRSVQIGRSFGRWLLSSKIFGEGGLRRISGFQAERLREILTDLGPAFVKIGQALSSRPDIVPPGFLTELEKLQDNIPPFSNEEAMQIIEEDLGQPVEAIFSEISATSVAAASLGQVYKAKVRSSGRWVAVKVQRPRVRETIALDVHVMRYFAGQLGKLRKLNSDLPSLLDEWAGSLFRELDYVQEAENGILFKQLYSHLEGIYVPDMLPELTTQRVLTMEWLDGVRLRSAGQSPSNGQTLRAEDMKLIEFGVQCSLEQMLEEGFYHADPHPGNLLRLKNGKLGYMDFGMMASIGPKIRRSLITATLHMVNREFGSLAADFESLGLLPPGSDKERVEPALAAVFEKALAGGVSNMSFGSLSGDLGKTMYEFKFRIPAYYILLVRSLSVLEGIALSSDPDYKVLGAAYPWIARRLLSAPGPELQESLRALLYKDDKFQFNRLESLLRQALKSPARLDRAGGGFPAGSAFGEKPLELLLGKEGSFLRGLVLDEMAKGIDAALRLSTDGLLGQARRRLTIFFRGSAGQGSAAPTQSVPLLRALQGLPALADKSDQLQVQGIQNVVNSLQSASLGANQAKPVTQRIAPTGYISEAIVILQWFLREVGNLSPAARAEALRIPLSLGGRLSSRLLARAVKAIANRDPKVSASRVDLPMTNRPTSEASANVAVQIQSAPQENRPVLRVTEEPKIRNKGVLVVKEQTLAQQVGPSSTSVPISQPFLKESVKANEHSELQKETASHVSSQHQIMSKPATLHSIEIMDKSDSLSFNEDRQIGVSHSQKSQAANETVLPVSVPVEVVHGESFKVSENLERELTAADAHSFDWRIKRQYQRQQEQKEKERLAMQT